MFDIDSPLASTRALAAAVEGLLDEDVAALPDETVALELAHLVRERHRIDAAIADRMSGMRRRDLSHHDGARTPRAWLTMRLRLSQRDAGRYASLARHLEDRPTVREAIRSGCISTEAAMMIGRGLRDIDDPQVADLAEQRLTTEAGNFAPEQLHRLVDRIRETVIPQKAQDDAEADFERRGIHASETLGVVHLNGRLSAEFGSLLLAQLREHSAPLPDDDRTPAQRRHDTLHELLRLATGATQAEPGRRACATLVAHLADVIRVTSADAVMPVAARFGVPASPLNAQGAFDDDVLARPPTFDVNTVTDWRTALTFLCDAEIARVVLSGDDVPLNLGRTTRQWSPAQRREIARRDRTCTWGRCQRPAPWCEIDHIKPWWEGGTTDVSNGRLLCHYHHRLRHQGWTLTPTGDGRYEPNPPDDWLLRLSRRRRPQHAGWSRVRPCRAPGRTPTARERSSR